MISTIQTNAWQKLIAHFNDLQTKGINLVKYFEDDPERDRRFTSYIADLEVNFSRNLITADTVSLFTELAQELEFTRAIAEMIGGQKINRTENRAVLHTALRRPANDTLLVDGIDVVKQVDEVKQRMYQFVREVSSGAIRGLTGKRISTIVNIGIGGSDLGPRMVYEGLRDYCNPILRVKFVSNVDPDDIHDQLIGVDSESVLFVVVSKTWTTIETLTNAKIAKNWLIDKFSTKGTFSPEQIVSNHFAAVSTNIEQCSQFGIEPSKIFGFWDWVGGRFSIGSAVALSLVLSLGPDNFEKFLAGQRMVDEYFINTPIEENGIIRMALINVWYNNFFGSGFHAVIPYSQRLARFPAYLQQLLMESNGKSVKENGVPVDLNTSEVWFGDAGTNAQHAFFQLLHQGTRLIPVDLIGVRKTNHNFQSADFNSQELLIANLLGQSQALAFGKSAEQVKQSQPDIDDILLTQKVFTGNRPSTVIWLDQLTPRTLGELIALYEHIAFIQGKVWEIDSFDQWGVELGKELAKQAYRLK
jgi:glucose-6-phosphate isomerase